MPSTLSLNTLQDAMAGDAAALRCRSSLQPAGGPGDKVFPPTYEGGVYIIEKRRLAGREDPATCVLLDSVQSQANRMEEALQVAIDLDQVRLPLIKVDFSDANASLIKPIDENVTSLTAPHRLADAILRDSEVEPGVPFRDSRYADRWRSASNANATPVYELCPTALLFGMWGAPEKPGGLGAKFQRAIRSEVVAIDAVVTDQRKGLRNDPLGIQRGASVIVGEENRWENATEKNAKKAKRPSEINHGPILFGPSHGGITMNHAEQIAVLSLAALRWLRFPGESNSWEPSDDQLRRDDAARTVLASIGICAWTLAFAGPGMSLRSGCDLCPQTAPEWELLAAPGEEPQRYSTNAEAGIKLLREAVDAARQAGLVFDDDVVLQPSGRLVELVRRSQEIAREKDED